MSAEILSMVYCTGLLIALVLIQSMAGVRAQGLPLAHSRDGLPPPEGFHARMKRVVDNHREGLIMFAPLALAIEWADMNAPITALAANIFFYSRIAHAAVYILGLPWIRPLIWTAGIAATITLLLALLGVI